MVRDRMKITAEKKFDFPQIARNVAPMMKASITSVYDRRRFLTRAMLALGAVGVAGGAAGGSATVALPEWLEAVAGHCVWSRGPDGATAGAWHIGVKDAEAAMTALMKSLPAGTRVLAAGQSLRLTGKAVSGELMLHIA
jgi:hypothetical protein